jgi:hypothetical protein
LVAPNKHNITADTRLNKCLLNQVLEKKSVPAFAYQAERGFGVRENAGKEKGPVKAADPKIHKAPYTHERNLYREFISI